MATAAGGVDDDQQRLLQQYDKTAPFRGMAGTFPRICSCGRRIDARSSRRVAAVSDGAYPYCFRLADAKTNKMGQSPGTHWYHAHKHGSTALNVANGMTGAFIIEGQYDDDLRRFYGPGFRDQVLVIQQLSTTPFPCSTTRTHFRGPIRSPSRNCR